MLAKKNIIFAHCAYNLSFQIYSNPQSFNPSRFLDADGQLKKQDELLTFSLGKRACPGEGKRRPIYIARK